MKRNRKLTVCYQIATPESVENGDYERQGIEEEIKGLTLLETIEVIREYEYVIPSSFPGFHTGIWYQTCDPVKDSAFFEKGEEKTFSFHLIDYSSRAQKAIFNRLKKEGCIS